MKRTRSSLSSRAASACSEEAPSDRIRVSGHVEATETRLAPEVGGRILTLTREGRRSRAARPDRADARHRATYSWRSTARRPSRPAGSAAAAGPSRRAGRRHPPGAVADRNRARRSRRSTSGARRPPNRISNASTRCSRTTPARASSETMRRRGGMWRGTACAGESRVRTAEEVLAKFAPAPAARKSTPPAPASSRRRRRSRRSRRPSTDATLTSPVAAWSPRSSSKSAR